jgi:hypothetical protein
MLLYLVEGWTASDRAVAVLKTAGIKFDEIHFKDNARSWADLRELGFTLLPTLTMFGARYEGLVAIKAFANKETESKKIADSQKTDELE